MIRFFGLSAVLLSLLLTTPQTMLAGDEQGAQKGPPPFSQFDRDGDGQVSEEEFHTTRNEHHAAMAAAGRPMKGMASAPSFSDVDTDGNGALSETELTAAQQAHMKQMQAEGKGRGGCKGQGKGYGQEKGQGMTESAAQKESET
jgi:hypothetical protein